MEYDNAGQIALWKNDSDHEKAPQAKGHFFAHRDIKSGEKIEVALWRNQSDNQNAPMMKGKISDGMAASSNNASQPAATVPQAQDENFDDDIPF